MHRAVAGGAGGGGTGGVGAAAEEREGLERGRAELRTPSRRLRLPSRADLGEVAAGEELLISYGDAYWDDRGFPMWNPRRWLIDYL